MIKLYKVYFKDLEIIVTNNFDCIYNKVTEDKEPATYIQSKTMRNIALSVLYTILERRSIWSNDIAINALIDAAEYMFILMIDQNEIYNSALSMWCPLNKIIREDWIKLPEMK